MFTFTVCLILYDYHFALITTIDVISGPSAIFIKAKILNHILYSNRIVGYFIYNRYKA